MKILMINVVCGIRSTGRICTDLAEELEAQGHEVKIAYGRESVPEKYQKYAVRIGTDFSVKIDALKTRILDNAGFNSKKATRKFIKWVEEYDPDVIHLHNIHGYYINVEILFNYLKTCGKKIIWTLHDCWTFTGHCVYFDYVECDKWKTGCNHCPQKKEYPSRIGLDMSKPHYELKKRLFTGISQMTLITPSQWLAGLISDSYMSDYTTIIINNGVDTTIFKPSINMVHEKYKCIGKKIVLGVAAVWDKRKGISTFIELAKHLDDSYQIILVGLSKEQIAKLPDNIVGIERTNSVRELAELYSAAEVFVNPTLEDNYPTTNIESIACGTPVISFNTGGSAESASMYGITVSKHSMSELVKAVEQIRQVKPSVIDVDYIHTVRKYIALYGEK